MNSQILNKKELLARLCNDENLFNKIIALYLDDTPRQIAYLGEAIKKGDIEVAIRKSHTIKGSSGNISAFNMQQIAHKMENTVKREDFEEAKVIFKELQDAFLEFKAFLNDKALDLQLVTFEK